MAPHLKYAYIKLIILLFAISNPFIVSADAIYWGCNYPQMTFHLGAITCTQSVNCKKAELSCWHRNKLLFVANDFADTIAASPDGRYLAGLSNLGSENAFWIRRDNGEVVDYKPHNDGETMMPNGKGGYQKIPEHSSSKLHYCSQSVTNIRKWYNQEKPNIQFNFDNGKLIGITVTGCDGDEVALK